MHIGNCTDDTTYFSANGAPHPDPETAADDPSGARLSTGILKLEAGQFVHITDLIPPIKVTYYAKSDGTECFGEKSNLQITDDVLAIKCPGATAFVAAMSQGSEMKA